MTIHSQSHIEDALLCATASWPYLGQTLAGLRLLGPDKRVKSMSIDARRCLAWSDEWVTKQTVTDLATMIAWHHLAGHWARGHFGRRLTRQVEPWEQACCQEINAPSAGGVRDVAERTGELLGDTDGRLAESYYDEDGEGGGCGGMSFAAHYGADDDDSDDEERARDVLADSMIRAAASGHSEIPDGATAWANARRPPPAPPAPWRRKLCAVTRRTVAEHGRRGRPTDTWAKMTRRPPLDETLKPGSKYSPPSISIVVDASGSVDEHGGVAAVAEVRALMRSANVVSVYSTDARAYKLKRGEWEDPAKYRGSGGTLLATGLAAAEADADIVVVIGDGDWHGVAEWDMQATTELIALAPEPPPKLAGRVVWVKWGHE